MNRDNNESNVFIDGRDILEEMISYNYILVEERGASPAAPEAPVADALID